MINNARKTSVGLRTMAADQQVWTLPYVVVCGLLPTVLYPSATAGASRPEASGAYERRATWYDTLIASREALARSGQPGGRPKPLPDFGRDDFAITAWIRTQAGGTILSKSPAKGAWKAQGKSFFVREGKLCYDIGWVGVVASKRRVADGKWHHVALAKQGSDLHLYIDGRLDKVGRLKGRPDIREHVLKIGYTSTDFPNPSGFRGDLDELRLYRRRLSDNDVKARFESPRLPRDDGLVAHWSFDDDGSDVSGQGLHAVLADEGRFVPGKVGKAVRLDGSAHAVVGLDPHDRLWGLLQRDFRDPVARQEMTWELEDRIWEKDWRPGDWAELARRYARASHRSTSLAQKASALARRARDRAGLAEVRGIYLHSRRWALARDTFAAAKPQGLRTAIAFLSRDHPEARTHLTRLDAIERRLADWETLGVQPEAVSRLREDLARLQRDALVTGNPLMAFDKLLFVKRPTYQSSHYYTDYIDGCVHYGGNLCVLSLRDGKVTELVPKLNGGIFGRYDLSFDAKRVLFDYKAAPRKGFRIYEIGVDGTGLRQLTLDPPDEDARIKRYDNSHVGGTGRIYYHQTDDMHPCYLPDGGICFISSRCERGILCDGPDILTTTTLYRMDADGKHMQVLSDTPVSEEVPTVMNDGRILYTRWEYVDKGGSAVKCLWVMRPDGSGSVEIFGNDHAFPSFYNGRAIPGHNNLFVVIGGPHMPLGVGTVIRLDINHPIRTREPMTYLTPDIDIQSEWGYRHQRDGKWVAARTGPLFDDPYPLSDKFFLVSYNPDRDVHDVRAYGLYLLDAFGNRVLIHRDPKLSCWQPMPLRPRTRPPVLPSMHPPREASQAPATLVMTDVYQGLEDIARGTIKYLRVMETVPRPWTARRFWKGDEHGQQHAVVSLWTHTHVKVLHGIVPVDEDGSAHFTVPADKNIFFQALDEDFMEVQRMRTFLNFRPGEKRSCIGCHTPRRLAPPYKTITALRRPPDRPAPQPGEAAPRPIHYVTDVQPILDKHCVRCHGGEKPKAKLDLSGTLTTLFNTSYENLLKRGVVRAVSEIRQKMGNVPPVPPKTWGSHASKLIVQIRKGHHDVKLSRTEFIKLVTWVDANAPYYGSYYGRRNLRYRTHPDFRPVPTVASASGVPPGNGG